MWTWQDGGAVSPAKSLRLVHVQNDPSVAGFAFISLVNI